jgi:hypothetical protein
MMRSIRMMTIGAALAAAAVSVAAQKTTPIHPGGGGSPHERTEWTLDGASVSIEYGRPSMKGRKIFGELVPYGKVWRTGADEATTLKTDKDLVIGGTDVPAGTYTLFTIPTENTWKLVINKQTGQSGLQYDEKQDLARIDMRSQKLAQPVEQLTINVQKQFSGGGGVLTIDWADTRASVAVNVKK